MTHVCKWCGNSFSKLATSHIFPKALLSDQYLIDNKDKYRPVKKRPSGFYARDIKCINCEESFSWIDNRGIDTIRKISDIASRSIDKDWIFISKTYQKDLQLLTLYTLWKLSASEDSDFKHIYLGPYQDKIKEIISQKEYNSLESFTMCCCYIGNSFGSQPVRKVQISGITFYRIEFNNFVVDIKIDSRKAPEPYLLSHEASDLIVIVLENYSKEKQYYREAIIKRAYVEKYQRKSI